MTFDLSLLENLLHQEEGPALDFKEEQYLFENADVRSKAELLKDILALANSWRLTTAYILIGVREVKGGRSEIIGVESHLDDANLHQFVNGKTQRPVEFSYLPFRTVDGEIGVIHIPLQERPVHLKRRFGGIDKNEVLIRDGSSTRVASPDEIARMGAERALSGTPQFILEWADVDLHEILHSPHTVHSLVLDPMLPRDTFARRRSYGLGIDPFANRSYSKELIVYAAKRNFLTPLGFRLHNKSGTAGKRIRFTGHVTKFDGLVIREWIDDVPSPNSNLFSPRVPEIALRDDENPSLSVMDFDEYWEVVIDFGDIRPHDEVWTDSCLFVGSTIPGVLLLRGALRGDNLPDPIKCELEVQVGVECRQMGIDDVTPYLGEE